MRTFSLPQLFSFCSGEREEVDPDGIPGRGEGGTQPVQSDVHFDISADYGELTAPEIARRALIYFIWLAGFFGVAAIIGLLPAMFVFMVTYMVFEGKEPLRLALTVAGGVWVLSYLLFHEVLVIPWPQSIVGDLFPYLRTIPELNMF